MTPLPKEIIDQYIRLWDELNGREVDEEQAQEEVHELIAFMRPTLLDCMKRSREKSVLINQ